MIWLTISIVRISLGMKKVISGLEETIAPTFYCGVITGIAKDDCTPAF
jgi:hypothetical protein